MFVHPFTLNLFELNTGKLLDKNTIVSGDLKNCVPLLTMNFVNRKLTLGDVFKFDNFYFIFTGYKGKIHYQIPDIQSFNFIVIEDGSELFNDEIDYSMFNSYKFEYVTLKDLDKKKFEERFEFLFNYFCIEKNMFSHNRLISMYLNHNNNFGIKFRNKGSILFELLEKPLDEVKTLLNEPFTFYIITDFTMFDNTKMLNVNPGDIYSFINTSQEQKQLINYFLEKNKITKRQLENTKKYYSSVIHILDKYCEFKQVSIKYVDFSEQDKYFIDYVPNLFWLNSFEKTDFDLKNNDYLEKYLLLIS